MNHANKTTRTDFRFIILTETNLNTKKMLWAGTGDENLVDYKSVRTLEMANMSRGR